MTWDYRCQVCWKPTNRHDHPHLYACSEDCYEIYWARIALERMNRQG